MQLQISNSWLVLFTAFCGQNPQAPISLHTLYQYQQQWPQEACQVINNYPCSKCYKTYQSLTRKERKWKIYNHIGSEAIQISNTTKFTQWKKPPTYIAQEAGWSHKLLDILEKRPLAPARSWNMIPQMFSPWPNHYTNYITLASTTAHDQYRKHSHNKGGTVTKNNSAFSKLPLH